MAINGLSAQSAPLDFMCARCMDKKIAPMHAGNFFFSCAAHFRFSLALRLILGSATNKFQLYTVRMPMTEKRYPIE